MKHRNFMALALILSLSACGGDTDSPSSADDSELITTPDDSDTGDSDETDNTNTGDSDDTDNTDSSDSDDTDNTDNSDSDETDNTDSGDSDETDSTDNGDSDDTDNTDADDSNETDNAVCINEQYTIQLASDDGSYQNDYSPDLTIDGDTSDESRWSSEGIGKEITFDLGETKTFSSLQLKWLKGDERSSYFEVQTSADSETWSTVLEDQSSSGEDEGFEIVNLPESVTGQYFKIVGLGNSVDDNDWNSLVEVEVYKCDLDEVVDSTDEADDSSNDSSDDSTDDSDNSSDETDNSTSDEIGAQPSVGSIIAASGAGPDNCDDSLCPSDLMRNFLQWKITLPDGEEIKGIEDEANEYFYVNEDNNGIVFYAPVRSDNETTANSTYIRSELREREEDDSADIYWTTDGTHVVYVKQAITHLPTVKDELVATQIHGNKDDGIDDAMVLRLEGEHLFLSFNGGKLEDDLTIKTDYTLGTLHEVIFEVIDGKHYVYYSEEGGLSEAYLAGNASDYLIKRDGADYVMDLDYDQSYFKVGNYTQTNSDKEGDETDEPDNYGEVVVFDFWVNHED